MYKRQVVGTDCGFGYKRAGNAKLLEKLAPELGFSLKVIEKEQEDHRDISSTYIREMLDQGCIEKANELLGRPYSIHGRVVRGNHIGSSILGFPTANLLPSGEDVYKRQPMSNPPLIKSLAYDPILGNVKLIAEAWDAGGMYQVGRFPADVYKRQIYCSNSHRRICQLIWGQRRRGHIYICGSKLWRRF